MQDLRLIGVHEDGQHLLLADDDGNRFQVPLDEPLRAAARHEKARTSQLTLDVDGGLRPKDVQALIRAGLSAEDVADRAGWPVEKVRRYEGPILAERDHVAGLAQQVRLRPRGGTQGATPTLGARVVERMRSREIDVASASWDSRRADKGVWTVVVQFTAGGRARTAAWDFDVVSRAVTAVDDEARWLSEDEDTQTPGPLPAPHLAPSGRPSRVYDVEAEGGISAPSRRREGDPVDLMAAMRERSAQRGGRRRRPRADEVPGLEQAPEEALPLEELARRPEDLGEPPAAHTHPQDDPEARPAARDDSDDDREVASHDDEPADRAEQSDRSEPEQPARSERADDHRRASRRDAEDETGEDVTEERVAVPETPAARQTASRQAASGRKSGRPSVPSWDDIMFGRRSE